MRVQAAATFALAASRARTRLAAWPTASLSSSDESLTATGASRGGLLKNCTVATWDQRQHQAFDIHPGSPVLRQEYCRCKVPHSQGFLFWQL